MPALAAVGALMLQGCVEESTVIKINRDGSGIIHERSYAAATDDFAIFPGLDGKKGKDGKDEPALPGKAALEEYAATLGEGVTFQSVKRSTNKKGWKGYEIVFAFEDINAVRYARNTPKPESGDRAEGDQPKKKKDDFLATFTMQDDELTIKMEKEGLDKAAAAPAPDPGGPTIDPYADASGPRPAETDIMFPGMSEAMLETMVKGMRMGLFVQIDDEIAKTNAAHRNGKLITLFHADLGALLENDEGMATLNSLETLNRTQLQEAADDLDGLDMDLQDPIRVRFK
ncbi:MAG: hypothetical protein HKN82_12035 [Akkermansiaceae bacterium]|nr:hypothetical protein [Akkermansiaceae bacterium]NNM29776.1 hypothetical protein [Akkermansiaceae bacterium]